MNESLALQHDSGVHDFSYVSAHPLCNPLESMLLWIQTLKSCSSANTTLESIVVLTFDVVLHRCAGFSHLKVTFDLYGLLAVQHGFPCKPVIHAASSRFATDFLPNRLLAEQHDLCLQADGHAALQIQTLVIFLSLSK